jgi:acetyl-CoA C-acetyltransferase
MNDKDIVIVSGARTPFCRYGRSLKDYDYFDLGAIPIREVLEKVHLEPKVVGEVVWGVGDTSGYSGKKLPKTSMLGRGL